MAESFAGLLKRHRVAAGLSQEALAERAGVSVDTISYLERGVRHAPQKATLDLLIDALMPDDDARRRLEEAAKLARGRGPQTHGHAVVFRNLPRTLTPLIGRAGDVNAVLDLLERYPLVTITGSGGVGKTRVALEVGDRYAERKSREVAFVDLSPLADGSLVVDAIANVVGAQQGNHASSYDALLRHLRNRALLLIVDNCEHLLDDLATVASAILQTCPSVNLLTTSRERLNIAGEAVFRLPTLAFPSDERAMAKNAGSYTALQLFAERAKAVDSRFELNDESAHLVADICRRLEGIPLAIELAAARLPVFGLATLQTRVSERFVLTGVGRGVPSRQATMQATIAWSYALLHDAQRTLLNRFAVFTGGCSLEAVECVCADEELHVCDIASLLASLVDKSLVNASFDTDPIRYTLFDSVRAYALEQLAVTNTSDAISRRHALWLAKQTDEWRRRGSTDIKPFLPELGNVRSALQWALSSAHEEDVITAGRIAGGLRRLWSETNRLAEYRFWSESLINRIDEHRYPEVVGALLAGLVQASLGPAKAAAIERAIPLFEEIGDYVTVVHLHAELSAVLVDRGRFEQAENVAAKALHISEMHNLEHSDAYVHILGQRGSIALMQRQTDEGRAYAMRALKMLPVQDRWRPWLTALLGAVEFSEGNTARALELTEDACRMYGNAGRSLVAIRSNLSAYHLLLNHLDTAAEIAREVVADSRELIEYQCTALQLAAIAAFRGHVDAAARVLGVLDEQYEKTEFRLSPVNQATRDVLVAALRERLSEAAIDRLKFEGREMTFDQAIDEVLRMTEVPVS